jgi:hypothetical protein
VKAWWSYMTLVMGIDRHRAQISEEWIETITGEISRARVASADRAGVRRFLTRFRGQGLEVALEATTGWRVRPRGLTGSVPRCTWPRRYRPAG